MAYYVHRINLIHPHDAIPESHCRWLRTDGLNGQPCGEVTEEDKSVASELLKRRLEQMKQKNSQQSSAGGKASDDGQRGTET